MDQPPEQIHRSFAEAFNHLDLDGVCALYEPDALLVTSQGPAQGSAAIREVYRAVFAMRPTIRLETLEAHRSGEFALLFGKWELRGSGADGAEVRRQGRNTEIVRRQGDGRWLFVIDNPQAPE
jgi:uncharacterized protein (TIGR02246 family)